jgi:hypothetical protein
MFFFLKRNEYAILQRLKLGKEVFGNAKNLTFLLISDSLFVSNLSNPSAIEEFCFHSAK